jgi:hypothetical protein
MYDVRRQYLSGAKRIGNLDSARHLPPSCHPPMDQSNKEAHILKQCRESLQRLQNIEKLVFLHGGKVYLSKSGD